MKGWTRRRVFLPALAVLTALWLFMPSMAIIPMSFNGRDRLSVWPNEWSVRLYARFFEDTQWYMALVRSLWLAVVVCACATVIGTAAAFAIDRGFPRLRGAMQTLILTPLILPVVIASIADYRVFLGWGFVGEWYGLVFCHTCLAIPFVTVPVLAALQTADRRLEFAARSLGSSAAGAIARVTLPLIRQGVFVGAFLAFMASFDETVISLFIAGRHNTTLPVKMFASMTEQTDPTIAAAAAIVLTVATIGISSVGVTRLAKARVLGLAEEARVARGERKAGQA